MKMINKKLMSEIISTTVEKEKRINLNMDSKNNSMHLCIMNIELSNWFFIR